MLRQYSKVEILPPKEAQFETVDFLSECSAEDRGFVSISVMMLPRLFSKN